MPKIRDIRDLDVLRGLQTALKTAETPEVLRPRYLNR
jgi:hypothetical protein